MFIDYGMFITVGSHEPEGETVRAGLVLFEAGGLC